MEKLANHFLKSTYSIECENYKLPTWKSFVVYYTCFRISFHEMRLPFYFYFWRVPKKVLSFKKSHGRATDHDFYYYL
jgi:hypothetical protein